MTVDYVPLSDLTVSRSHIENCAFSNWYSLFKQYTPKSKILKPVPQSFIEYLEQDGIKLPKDETVRSFYTSGIAANEDNEYSDWEDDEAENSSGVRGVQLDHVDPLRDFPDLHNELKSIINDIGPVTPKLNWSAPKDATWILPNNTMKCIEVNEIYLLLNASNYIMHDLQHAFDECGQQEQGGRPQYELILREWFNINPAMEFRVFVKDQRIIGVTQRDINYYDYLDALSETFKDLIDEFVDEVVTPKFPDSSFVLDVYIPRPFQKVYLIDINPFARKTDTLLFSWNELLTVGGSLSNIQDYELRLVKENNTARFASKEHSENHVPKDIVDASLDPNAIRDLAQKWKELLSQQQAEDSSSGSEEEA
ncbi:cell proliferation protein CDC123 KNAG_0B02750 [Huiozyma naganishii CBS 8797]|uniref:Translation initiation factor eIF2 assembly protein n=1 Tax=Huiozyma naganishii (strain ATCC MYA-139 / BCRC 22969 / CBS 8797 / KCTC 17520 / NBRC 10181 / NCYC 3082 / Yp74L-3) TaxID=1071383 RepID=J7RGP9_HUIN7|nr:hypothetical protein KNAG_0B02750 [Kazachstania naganishii CBS 8797]CCK68718.1 hypothetical protein KNAG_0B02750 [Kazachstania naganishii CBS 8797]